MENLMTLKQVMDCVHMTKSTIYRYINKGEFPSPIKMDSTNPASASMWRESDVANFIDTRPRAFNTNGEKGQMEDGQKEEHTF